MNEQAAIDQDTTTLRLKEAIIAYIESHPEYLSDDDMFDSRMSLNELGEILKLMQDRKTEDIADDISTTDETTKEKKSVWMVTSGEYSDYSVNGVFSTRELAQDYVDAFSHDGYGGQMYINEETLDPGNTSFHKMGRRVYRVKMDRKGNSCSVDLADNYSLTDCEWRGNIGIWNTTTNIVLWVDCWATDVKHATKIANEIRTQKIASGDWDREVKEIEARYKRNDHIVDGKPCRINPKRKSS